MENIRSIKAKEWVKQACFYDDGTPRRATLFDMKRAVKLAEIDARDKVIKAYTATCEHRFSQNVCRRYPGVELCMHRGCVILNEFLSHYDNEDV